MDSLFINKNNIKEINDVIICNTIKTVKPMNESLKNISVAIDKICLVPEGDHIVQYFNESVTGMYLSEWKNSVGNILRKDMTKIVKSDDPSSLYFKYYEILSDDKKYLIRCINIDNVTNKELEELKEHDLIHGEFNGSYFTLIKALNKTDAYASKQLLDRNCSKGDYTYTGVYYENQIKTNLVPLSDEDSPESENSVGDDDFSPQCVALYED